METAWCRGMEKVISVSDSPRCCSEGFQSDSSIFSVACLYPAFSHVLLGNAMDFLLVLVPQEDFA
ncbi:hypothetical protein Nepgr_012185 [Nepenthes gracilis]|uniref:Uncharacterized protein n=1 Tax=Nepenthes gracilis TaxID=150966 RepID=A0AAD3SGJ8_NEPGR|nr:hypothetical protein Nepgr_012185 [Nepenthes gracilis]